MDLRKALLESGNQVEEILKWKIRVQSADDVEFRNGLGIAGGGGLESLFQRHGVRARRVLLTPKSTEAAGSNANISGVQMAVNVEIRFVAMHTFADEVRHPA